MWLQINAYATFKPLSSHSLLPAQILKIQNILNLAEIVNRSIFMVTDLTGGLITFFFV